MTKIILIAGVLLQVAGSIRGQVIREDDPVLKGIGVIEHLGDTIPLDLRFTDDLGRELPLRTFFHRGKPVILVLAYYNCPMLCTMVLNGIAEAVKGLEWTPGERFEMLTISIDTTETTALAAAKKKSYIEYISKPGADSGWSFFTGHYDDIQKLADALGFKYYYVEETREFAHPAVVFVLMEDGRLSRYLYGLNHRSQDVRLSLLEASEGRIGNALDRLILYCFHYDPEARGYVLWARNVMKIGGLATVAAMAIFLLVLWRRERKTDAVQQA